MPVREGLSPEALRGQPSGSPDHLQSLLFDLYTWHIAVVLGNPLSIILVTFFYSLYLTPYFLDPASPGFLRKELLNFVFYFLTNI